MNRNYESPARDKRKSKTRTTILDALAAAVLEDGIHAFSVQHVADRAGVAHRTVYRHFPTRQALLDGLSERLLERMPEVDTIRADAISASFSAFDDVPELVQAYVVAAVALDLEPTDRVERTVSMRKLFDARFPHLDSSELETSFAVLRVMLSSRAWHQLRQMGVSGRRAAPELTRLFELFVQDLERRDQAAKAAQATRSSEDPNSASRSARRRGASNERQRATKKV